MQMLGVSFQEKQGLGVEEDQDWGLCVGGLCPQVCSVWKGPCATWGWIPSGQQMSDVASMIPELSPKISFSLKLGARTALFLPRVAEHLSENCNYLTFYLQGFFVRGRVPL